VQKDSQSGGETECCYVRATIVKTVLCFTVVEVDTALVHIASIKLDIMSSSENINPNLWSSLV